MDMEQDIKDMYKYYQMLNPQPGELGFTPGLSREEKQQRITMMQEELDEYWAADTQVDEYDALIDLLVFVVGTLVQSSYPLQQGWEAVLKANMSKVVGITKRGFAKDITKPPMWTGPEHDLSKILEEVHKMTDGHPRFGNVSDLAAQLGNDVTQWPTGGIPAGADGVVKADAGKTRYELIPYDVLKDIADVFAYGAEKYHDNSWRTEKPAAVSRTFASIMRHLTEFMLGNDWDPESGKSHLAHACTQLMMLMHVYRVFPETDDRDPLTEYE